MAIILGALSLDYTFNYKFHTKFYIGWESTWGKNIELTDLSMQLLIERLTSSKFPSCKF